MSPPEELAGSSHLRGPTPNLLTPPAGCTISARELEEQRKRMRVLARLVTEIDRSPGVLSLTFAADLDVELLEQMVAIERHCCSFLEFTFDPHARRLTICADDGNDRALDHFVPERRS